MTVPINVWTISIAGSVAFLWWLHRSCDRTGRGGYDFLTPLIYAGGLAMVVAWWCALIIGRIVFGG